MALNALLLAILGFHLSPAQTRSPSRRRPSARALACRRRDHFGDTTERATLDALHRSSIRTRSNASARTPVAINGAREALRIMPTAAREV